MRLSILALLAGLLSAVAYSQEISPETKERFAKALKKLGSEEFLEREAASAEIAALPAEAIRLVEAALLKDDLELEVRTRLKNAIPEFKEKARRNEVARRKAATAAWDRRTTDEAYKKAGCKDPKWDEPAVGALERVARVWARTATPGMDREAYDLCSTATSAGCNDPLVLYARARMYDSAIRKNFAEAMKLHLDAAAAMKDRGAVYHPMRQCFSFGRAADYLARSKKELSDEEKKQLQGWLDLAVARLGEGAADPEAPETILIEAGDLITAAWMKLTRDRKVGFDKVFETLTQARPESPLPLILKGQVYTTYAWDARGSGWANSVTEEGWKNMRERLAEAELALTEAWKKNPNDARAPTLMLGVELGQGKGRAVMETWYKRAMAADPDNFEACGKKMYYLEPKWHGSPEDMLTFGRELAAGGNWGARLPFKLVDAHLALAAYEEKEKKAEYYRNEVVWKDIRTVYEGYLKRYPDSDWDRSFYAKLASWCGQWAEAKAQFDKLGEKVMVGAFANRAELDRFKAEATAKGK